MIQHRLKLHTDKDAPKDQGVVVIKTMPFREQHLRFLLGKRRQNTLSCFPATAPTNRHHRNRGRSHGTGPCRQ